MRREVFSGILITITILLSSSALAECGKHEFVSRTEDVTVGNKEVHRIICKCLSGYHRAEDGSCVAIAMLVPAKPTVVRPQTRAECVREKGRQLQHDLKPCSSPFIRCLRSEGVPAEVATCTFGTLASAIAFAAVPSAPTTAAVVSTLAACQTSAKHIADTCAPTIGTCAEGPVAAFNAAVAACPAQ